MSRKDRAGLFGVVANRQYTVELLICELIDGFRPVAGDVDAKLLHDRDGFGTDAAWFRTCASDFEAVSKVVAQKALRHLATG